MGHLEADERGGDREIRIECGTARNKTLGANPP